MKGQNAYRTRTAMHDAIRREGLDDKRFEVENKTYHDGTFYKPTFIVDTQAEADSLRRDGWAARVSLEETLKGVGAK